MAEKSGRVLLLKALKEGDNDPYLKKLEAAGFSPQCIPVLGFTFKNLDQLQEELNQHEHYSAIVFTSQRSVEAVQLAMKDSRHRDKWKTLPAYVVGQATGELATKAGFQNIKGIDSGNAENLAEIIIKDMSCQDKKLLFPCGNLRKETIPKRLSENNISFEGITVYETSPDPLLKDNLREYLVQGSPDYMVFFSPSGVEFTAKLWLELGIEKQTIKCIAIGPSTEKSLEVHGMTSAGTAQLPSPQSLIQALAHVS